MGERIFGPLVMLPRSVVALVLCFVLCPVAGLAQSASDDDLRSGVTALSEGRAADAAPMLERAAQRGSPLAWFNLGLAYRTLGRTREAVEAWDAYLAHPEPDAAPERLGAVREERAALVRALATLRVSASPPTATLTIDQQIPRLIDGSLRLDAGPHALDAQAAGYRPWHRTITLTAGDETSLTVALERVPTAVPSRHIPWWTWLGAGVALASVGAIAGLAVDGNALYAAWEAQCLRGDASCISTAASTQSSLDARSAGITASSVVGAAGLAVAVAGLVLGLRAEPAAPRTLSLRHL